MEGMFRVPLENLLFKKPVTAGLNPFRLLGLVPLLKETAQDHDPIRVRKEIKDLYRIEDGRHRAIAYMIAGRIDIPCELDGE